MLQSEILREIGALSRSVQSINDIRLRQLHLQKGQFIFLTRICENPGISLVALSDLLKVDKTTTTKATQKLIKEGYALKERAEGDQRVWRLFPTEQARSAYTQVIDEENRCIQACFQNLSKKEQDSVYQLTLRMRKNIEQDWRQNKNRGRRLRKMSELCVREYAKGDEGGVLDVILPIQQQEFGIAITREDQPDLAKIPHFYQQGNGNFWVALDGGQIVGTIALIDIGSGEVALRKMFVKKNYRGGGHGTAAKLLQTLFDWVESRKIPSVYLGTTDKFLAAHRFYEKNGFEKVSRETLPASFPVMKVDTVFYRWSR